MSKQITLDEVLKLVSFEKIGSKWYLHDVVGDVGGCIGGSVYGDVTGNIVGDSAGDVVGNVDGNVVGYVHGNVGGGGVGGDVCGDVEGSGVKEGGKNRHSSGGSSPKAKQPRDESKRTSSVAAAACGVGLRCHLCNWPLG